MKKGVAFLEKAWYYTTCVPGCGSAWLERRLREAEVASSNPATPIGYYPVKQAFEDSSACFFLNAWVALSETTTDSKVYGVIMWVMEGYGIKG